MNLLLTLFLSLVIFLFICYVVFMAMRWRASQR